jgi:hypothetical protein
MPSGSFSGPFRRTSGAMISRLRRCLRSAFGVRRSAKVAISNSFSGLQGTEPKNRSHARPCKTRCLPSQPAKHVFRLFGQCQRRASVRSRPVASHRGPGCPGRAPQRPRLPSPCRQRRGCTEPRKSLTFRLRGCYPLCRSIRMTFDYDNDF